MKNILLLFVLTTGLFFFFPEGNNLYGTTAGSKNINSDNFKNNTQLIENADTLIFSVNMSIYIQLNSFNTLTDSVVIRGYFQTYAGDSVIWGGNKFNMMKLPGDTIYSLHVPVSLSSTIFNAPSRSVLQLVPGGLYTESNNYNFGTLTDKKLTIEVPGNNPQKAVLKINKAPDNLRGTSFFLLTDSSSIIIKNLEVDGSLLGNPSAYAFILFSTGGENPVNTHIKKIQIDNCDIHDISGFVIDGANCSYAGYLVIDSTFINNCIIHNTSTSVNYKYAGAKFVSLTNSTIYNTLSYGFRICGPAYTTMPDKTPEVVIDHTTWYNIGVTDPREIILLEKGPNLSPWTVTNSIFAKQVGKTRTVINIKEIVDSSLAAISNICLWDTGPVRWFGYTVHDTVTMEPQFQNPDAGNFALPQDSPLLTYGTDGGPIGDPRWQGVFSGLSISGKVIYDNNANTPLAGMDVYISGQSFASTKTNVNGNFVFNGLTDGSYQLLSYTTRPWYGANATDALVVLLHTAQLQVLSGLRLAAADVDNSSNVNSTDALDILRRSVGLINSFPSGDWKLDSLNVNMNGNNAVQNLKGINIGDVNGSNIPGISKTSSAIAVTNEGSINFNSNGGLKIPLEATNNFEAGAMTLIIKYPDALVELEGVTSKLKDLLYKADNGILKIGWYNSRPVSFKSGEPLVNLDFKPKKDFNDAGDFKLSLEPGSEIAGSDASVLKNMAVNIPLLSSIIPKEYSLSQNYPNPFNPNTTIKYDLPEQAKVTIEVFNVLGEKVKTLENSLKEAGNYKIELNAGNLASGVYIYRLVAHGKKDFTQVKKMIFLK